MNPSELEALTQLCVRLGAGRDQAAVMAAQLIRRADQLAAERGRSREAELTRLLDLLVRGRAGEVPAEFKVTPPSTGDSGKSV